LSIIETANGKGKQKGATARKQEIHPNNKIVSGENKEEGSSYGRRKRILEKRGRAKAGAEKKEDLRGPTQAPAAIIRTSKINRRGEETDRSDEN